MAVIAKHRSVVITQLKVIYLFLQTVCEMEIHILLVTVHTFGRLHL